MKLQYEKNTFLSCYKGKKVAEPIACKIKLLSGFDVPKMMKLQEGVLDDLGEGQTFISVNTPQDFMASVNGEKGVTLGVFDQNTNELIAIQSLKTKYQPDVDVSDITSEPVACLASFMVKKEYQGNRLTSLLMNHLMHLGATQFGLKHFVSYVDADNPASYTHHLQAGFGLLEAYVDDVFHAESYALMISDDKKVNDNLYFPVTIPKVGDFQMIYAQMHQGKVCTHNGGKLKGANEGNVHVQ